MAASRWDRLALRAAGTEATSIPVFLYGTAWKKERTADLVYQALTHGFGGVDTAAQPKHYREDLVGEGIRRGISQGKVRRENLYVRNLDIPFHWKDIFPGLTAVHDRFKPNTPLLAAKIQITCPTIPSLRSQSRCTHR